jgi:hypothetical protein
MTLVHFNKNIRGVLTVVKEKKEFNMAAENIDIVKYKSRSYTAEEDSSNVLIKMNQRHSSFFRITNVVIHLCNDGMVVVKVNSHELPMKSNMISWLNLRNCCYFFMCYTRFTRDIKSI